MRLKTWPKMTIVNTSKYGEFKLLNDERQEIAFVTYPNYVPQRAHIEMGHSKIDIKMQLSWSKFFSFLLSRSKVYEIIKDGQAKGEILLDETSGVLKVGWNDQMPDQQTKYAIEVLRDDGPSHSLGLYDENNQKIMLAHNDFFLFQMEEEVELKVLSNNLEQDQLEELAVYFVQISKMFETNIGTHM